MMKRIKSLASLVLIAALFALPIGCTGGCKSASRNTLKASGVTHVGVTAGMRGYNQYLGTKDAELKKLETTNPDKAKAERAEIGKQSAQVQEAYGKYQAAQIATLTAAQEFGRIPLTDTNSPVAGDKLTAAIAASTATMGDVITLLQKFGITVSP